MKSNYRKRVRVELTKNSGFETKEDYFERHFHLTDEQLKIVDMLHNGYSLIEIANSLRISVTNVTNKAYTIYNKFGAEKHIRLDSIMNIGGHKIDRRRALETVNV